MKREDMKQFLNKRVFIRLANGFFFRGILMSVDDITVKINDAKQGITFLALSHIITINQDEKREYKF